MDPIIIEFKTSGIDDVRGDMSPLMGSIDKLNDSIQQATKAFADMGKASASSASGIRQTAGAARAARGPFQDLINAQERLNNAMKGGNHTAIKDAMVNLKRKQASAQRADDLLHPDPVAAMVKSARVFMGPAGNLVFNPLLRHVAGAGGPQAVQAIQSILGNGWKGASGAAGAAGATGGAEAAMAGVGEAALLGPAAAVGAAFIGIAAVVKIAQDRFMSLGKIMATSGSSYGQASQAMRLTGGLGLGDTQSVARAFSDAISSPGFANNVSRSIGINPMNNPYTGDLNDVSKLIKAIEYIVDPARSTDRQARAYARATGLEDALVGRNASGGVRQMLLDRQREGSNPAAIRAAADNQIMLNLAMQDFQKITADLGARLLPALSNEMKRVNKGLNAWERIFDMIPKMGDDEPKGFFGPHGGKKPSEDMKDALNQNTKALNGLNQTLNNGVYGAGSGGRTLPIGLLMQEYQREGTGRAVELGAFAL